MVKNKSWLASSRFFGFVFGFRKQHLNIFSLEERVVRISLSFFLILTLHIYRSKFLTCFLQLLKHTNFLSECSCHVCQSGLPFAVRFSRFLIYVNSVKINLVSSIASVIWHLLSSVPCIYYLWVEDLDALFVFDFSGCRG